MYLRPFFMIGKKKEHLIIRLILITIYINNMLAYKLYLIQITLKNIQEY
jgi:hypothetical protein